MAAPFDSPPSPLPSVPEREVITIHPIWTRANARAAFRHWFRHPRTMGFRVKFLAALYVLIAIAMASVPVFIQMNSEEVPVSMIIFGLTGLVAIGGLLYENPIFVMPFIMCFCSIALFGTIFLIRTFMSVSTRMNDSPHFTHSITGQMDKGASVTFSDILAIVLVVYIIGHGVRVVLAAKRRAIKKIRERNDGTGGYERF